METDLTEYSGPGVLAGATYEKPSACLGSAVARGMVMGGTRKDCDHGEEERRACGGRGS